ncbi:MDR family MFS transporter [Streptomyces zaomyceticus]|uniref:MDR family MFS transporter n=1 Tax=Streptomyces zaomyceticus TaxID=68286 RepID=UPI0016733579|nr:MFS transporter [Streptomyces zaomyceticus]GHG38407.1 MFS transporter [Streptomyces zaomyceticus]
MSTAEGKKATDDTRTALTLRSLHPNIRLRLGVGFVQRLLSIMLMPLLVIHLAGLYGAAVAGALTVCVAAAGIAANFLGGHLADVHGRRPVMVAGELGATLTFALLALANSPWWSSGPATFGLFLLNTCCSQLATPAADAMMVDVSTPENRPLVYTINYWSINLAFTVGALLGGFLYDGHFLQLLTGAAVLCLLTTAVMWRWISETAPAPGAPGASGPAAMVRGYLAVARDRVFLRQLAAATLIAAVEMQIGYYIAVRLADEFPRQTLLTLGSFGLDVDGTAILGVLRAVNAALVVALILAAKTLLGRVGERTRLYGGIAVFTVGYMIWAVSNSGWVLIAAAVLLTVGEIASVPVRQALLADLVDPEARTKYMAAYALNARVGLLVAALCVTLGAFVPAVGMSLLYATAGIAALLLYRSLLGVRTTREAETNLVKAA